MKDYHPYWHFQNQVIILFYIVVLFNVTTIFTFASEDNKIIQARQLFYQSMENHKIIEKAISLFKEIMENRAYEGLALTYIGALSALKGKFAFLPITKFRHVIKGLELMDQGVAKSPHNIEARFIRGMTCYYLPFFFNRKKTAHIDFKKIVQLLDQNYLNYNAELIMNVTDFLIDNAELNFKEIQTIKNIQNLINENEI